jgi:Flp pilus assembly protein TadG
MIRRETGQGTVEFALIFLLFLMLVLGIFEGSRLIFDYSLVSEAASEGVRYASVRGSTCEVPDGSSCTASATEITSYVQSKTVGLPVTVSVSWPGPPSGSNDPGNSVSVQVTYPFTPVVWFIPAVDLSSTAQMAIAR